MIIVRKLNTTCDNWDLLNFYRNVIQKFMSNCQWLVFSCLWNVQSFLRRYDIRNCHYFHVKYYDIFKIIFSHTNSKEILGIWCKNSIDNTRIATNQKFHSKYRFLWASQSRHIKVMTLQITCNRTVYETALSIQAYIFMRNAFPCHDFIYGVVVSMETSPCRK